MLLDRGLVHVYTGDGKGKTTAALGIAMRVLGWGGSVCMVQFVKGYPDIGEAHFAERLGPSFTLKQFAEDKSRAIGEDKVLQRRREAEAALDYAEDAISSGSYDLVILDEINNALHYRLIDVSRVVAILDSRPPSVEVVLTGRGAPAPVIEAADYVTELTQAKHPYEQGISARRGIDY